MTHEKLWEKFCEANHLDIDTHYSVWSFGGNPDAPVKLVIDEVKTATASAYELYELDDEEPMPHAGDYSVITDSAGDAFSGGQRGARIQGG